VNVGINIVEKAANPTVNDDSSNLSVRKGTIWINTSSEAVYICIDPSDGAAVWKQISN